MQRMLWALEASLQHTQNVKNINVANHLKFVNDLGLILNGVGSTSVFFLSDTKFDSTLPFSFLLHIFKLLHCFYLKCWFYWYSQYLDQKSKKTCSLFSIGYFQSLFSSYEYSWLGLILCQNYYRYRTNRKH